MDKDVTSVVDAISELSFLKDYWIIKSFYASNPDSMNPDLKELMNPERVGLELEKEEEKVYLKEKE